MKKKAIVSLLLAFIALFSLISMASAANYDQIVQRWTKKKIYIGDDKITNLEIKATYYSAELIEALVQGEAEKNLWTEQEKEDYKYKLLNSLNLNEMIPIKIEFTNNADTMYLGPFDIMIKMRKCKLTSQFTVLK